MKSIFTILFATFVLVFYVTAYAEQSPYLPNLRDNAILTKAEKSFIQFAQAGKKEAIVQIIWTVKTQLGILTDPKSQYILFELWRLAEEQLPNAISKAQESTGAEIIDTELKENTTMTWVEQLDEKSLEQENTSTSGSTETVTEETSPPTGKASYYASSLDGNHTANGDIFDNNALTAAHKTLPFNTRVKVINLKNDHRVVVRINDRWPFVAGRVIDLSQAAFKAINNDSLSAGILDVTLEVQE